MHVAALAFHGFAELQLTQTRALTHRGCTALPLPDTSNHKGLRWYSRPQVGHRVLVQRGRPAIENSRPLVLCVDDEKIGLQVRKLLLEKSGYSVLTAPDGPTGIEVFAAHPVQAVVLDFAMPGMDGGQVAAKMRALKPNIPILLLSAYLGLPPEITRIVNIYMTKGEGAPALLDKLRALLPN